MSKSLAETDISIGWLLNGREHGFPSGENRVRISTSNLTLTALIPHPMNLAFTQPWEASDAPTLAHDLPRP